MSYDSKESSYFAELILELKFAAIVAVFGGTMISVIAVLDILLCIASFNLLMRSIFVIFLFKLLALLSTRFLDAVDLPDSERIEHSEPLCEKAVSE